MINREPPIDVDFSRSGWMHWLPDRSLFLHAAIKRAWRLNLEGDLDAIFADDRIAWIGDVCWGAGLDGSAFMPCTATTDEERVRDTGLDAFRRAVVRRVADAVGMREVLTSRDAIELMRRLGLVRCEASPDRIAWSPITPLPLPQDRLELTPEEIRYEDEQRWKAWSFGVGCDVLRRLASQDRRVYHGSFKDLADELSVDPEDIRYGVLALRDHGSIAMSSDIERIEPYRIIEFDVLKPWEHG